MKFGFSQNFICFRIFFSWKQYPLLIEKSNEAICRIALVCSENFGSILVQNTRMPAFDFKVVNIAEEFYFVSVACTE